MPTWPLTLPRAPLVRALSQTAQDLVVRTSMDSGPAKVRRRLTVNVVPTTIGLPVLTDEQLETFKTFFHSTAMGGAEAFDWKDPATGQPARMRFVGQPSWSPVRARNGVGRTWDVQFNVELIPYVDVGATPSPTTTILIGSTGTTEFSNISTISCEIRRCCFVTDYGGVTSATRVFAYARTNSVSGFAVSVDWEWVAGDSSIARVTYSRDSGWAFSWTLAAIPSPAGACAGTDNYLLGGDETMLPYMRNKSYSEVVDGGTGETSPDIFCGGASGATDAWIKLVDATVTNIDGPSLPSRAQGFRVYTAACIAGGG